MSDDWRDEMVAVNRYVYEKQLFTLAAYESLLVRMWIDGAEAWDHKITDYLINTDDLDRMNAYAEEIHARRNRPKEGAVILPFKRRDEDHR